MSQHDRHRILLVDDNDANRELLRRRLVHAGHEVVEAVDGAQALARLREQAFDLVLLDLMMPVMDGMQALQEIKRDARLQHIPVIMVTAVGETTTAARCIELGAEDYLTKPVELVLFTARVNSCLGKKRLLDQEQRYRQMVEDQNRLLESRVQEQVQELVTSQLAMIFAMSKLSESKDPETGAHLERMREYCAVLAGQLQSHPVYGAQVDRAFIHNIYAASPLHDIGKVGVPDGILLKPGRLTEDEWAVMRVHTVIGAETLRAVDRKHPGNAFLRIGIDIADCHHEKWDGSGYPYGLKGSETPLPARILALADVYDALTSRRCYKEAMSHGEACEIVTKDSGRHFDPDMVEAFLAVEGEFAAIRRSLQDAPEGSIEEIVKVGYTEKPASVADKLLKQMRLKRA